ncbi:hypothetical protein KP509_24G041500 [Ceratopteris richardii]|nr:hypothetical protein KP509_24G041500 [Ceratopteris richardii]
MRNPFLNKQELKIKLKKAGLPFITAVIRRRKNFPLDSVVQRQKKLKTVTAIKDILIKEPGMVMSLKRLGRFRKKLRLSGKRKVIVLLKKFPAVFEVFEEGVNSLYFRLTQEAEDQVFEEIRLKGDLESRGVMKIRKMLMMSINKTLLLSKIDHLKRDLGLPDDYRGCMIGNYPQYFKVVETAEGTALELTSWDPELAISAWEQKRLNAPAEPDTISGRPRRFAKLDLPRGHVLKRKDAEMLRRFQQVSYISPYAEFAHYRPGSVEAEKHACAVVHELLSLMIEKRTLIDHLTHFRKDYKFSQQLYGMIVRHPELFYVSLKGVRDSVFLTEAYDGAALIEKDPLVVVKERLEQLAAIDARRFYRRKAVAGIDREVKDGGQDDDYDTDSEGWEDDDSDEDDNEDDGWSDLEESDDETEMRVSLNRDLHVNKQQGHWQMRGQQTVANGRDSKSVSHDPGDLVAAPGFENKPQRAPRRPLKYVLREEALATRASVPREKW